MSLKNETNEDIKQQQAFETSYELHYDVALQLLDGEVLEITKRIQVLNTKATINDEVLYADQITIAGLYKDLDKLNDSLYIYEYRDGAGNNQTIEYDFVDEVKKIVCDELGLTIGE